MRVVVIGGTGHVGTYLLPKLIETGHEVISVSRRKRSPYRPHAGLKISVADRPGHDRRYAMNINKMKLELGWTPLHGLREGLLKTVHWYLEHGAWVEAIRKQADYQAWLARNYTERTEGRT